MRYALHLHFLWRTGSTLRKAVHYAAWSVVLFQLDGWEVNMPLKKSTTPAAFRANVKAEVKSGKPVKQAVAIAYSVKREAAKPSPKGKK